MHYKLPLVFEPQPEGGFTVTSPLLPELVTEGETIEDALENVRDALAAVLKPTGRWGGCCLRTSSSGTREARSGRRWLSRSHEVP